MDYLTQNPALPEFVAVVIAKYIAVLRPAEVAAERDLLTAQYPARLTIYRLNRQAAYVIVVVHFIFLKKVYGCNYELIRS